MTQNRLERQISFKIKLNQHFVNTHVRKNNYLQTFLVMSCHLKMNLWWLDFFSPLNVLEKVNYEENKTNNDIIWFYNPSISWNIDPKAFVLLHKILGWKDIKICDKKIILSHRFQWQTKVSSWKNIPWFMFCLCTLINFLLSAYLAL